MDEKRSKHLVSSLSGVGLCIAGPNICGWHIVIDKEIISIPFIIAGVCITIIGVLCCLGALVCQSNRYNK